MPSRFVIIAGFVIAGSGVVNAWTNKKPITPIIIGAYVFVLVLAVLDMFGGGIATLANALAMLAVVYILLTEFPWAQVIALVQGKSSGSSSSGGVGGAGHTLH